MVVVKRLVGDELGENVLLLLLLFFFFFFFFFFGVSLLALLLSSRCRRFNAPPQFRCSLFSFLFEASSFSFFALTKTLDTPPESRPERGEVKSL